MMHPYSLNSGKTRRSQIRPRQTQASPGRAWQSNRAQTAPGRSGQSQAVPDRPRQTQTGPGRARQNQTAQAGSDGPVGRRAIRPRESQTGQTAQAGQTGFGHQAAQNQAHVPSCDNFSVNENSVEFQASSEIIQQSFAARSQISEIGMPWSAEDTNSHGISPD